MVSKSSDYKFVGGLEKIKIDGDIMPIRNGEDKKILRGEDIAFLAEYAAEINSLLGHDQDELVSMKDTRLLSDRVNRVLREVKFGNLNTLLSVGGGLQQITFKDNQELLSKLPKASLVGLEDPGAVSPGSKVHHDPIERAFAWTQRIRSVIHPRSVGVGLQSGKTWSYTCNARTEEGRVPENPEVMMGNLLLYRYFCENYDGTVWMERTHSEEYTVTGGSIMVSLPFTRPELAAGVFALITVNADATTPGGNLAASCTRSFEIVGTSVSIPLMTLLEMGSAAASYAGIAIPDPYAWYSASYSVSPSAEFQIVRGDHTLYS